MRNPLRRRKQGKSKGEEGYGEGKVTIDFGDDVLIDEEAMVEQLLKALSARFVLAPVLLYLAMVCSSWVLVCSSWVLVSVAVLTTFWDVYHSGMQTFGFGRIYDARAGNDPSVGRRLDLVLNQLLYAGPIVAGATMLAHFNRFEYFEDVDSVLLPQIPGLMETHQHYFTWGLLILGSGYLVYYLFSYWRLWQRGYQISLAKVFLLTTTGFCSIYTWGFNSWGEAFLIMNLFHAIQYFGLVWSSEKTTLRRLAGVRNPRIAKPASIAMLLCVTGAYGYWVEAFDADIEWLWAVTLTVSIMHFWYDGFIWSVRRKEV